MKVRSIDDINAPQKNYEEITVSGRDGSLFVTDNTYKNKIITIICRLDTRECKETDIYDISMRIKEWLLKDMKYKKLILSSDDEYYYEAVCINKIDFTEILTYHHELLLSFSCKPHKIKTMSEMSIENNAEIYSKSNSLSFPTLSFIAKSDSVNIYTNNNNMKLERLKINNHYIIDSELMNVTTYSDDMQDLIENANDCFESGDFIVIESGINRINWIGNIEDVKIETNIRYL